MTHLRVQKSIYWILQWGWRGPAIVILTVFLLWLYYLLAEEFFLTPLLASQTSPNNSSFLFGPEFAHGRPISFRPS
jgi:hypothetical protein